MFDKVNVFFFLNILDLVLRNKYNKKHVMTENNGDQSI